MKERTEVKMSSVTFVQHFPHHLRFTDEDVCCLTEVKSR